MKLSQSCFDFSSVLSLGFFPDSLLAKSANPPDLTGAGLFGGGGATAEAAGAASAAALLVAGTGFVRAGDLVKR